MQALTHVFNIANLTPESIQKFIFWNNSKPYTRNRIKTDNINYDLLILCWNPGKESKIHDHPGEGCFVRVLKGKMQESIFVVNENTKDSLIKRSEGLLFEGSVAFIDNDIGLHKLGNPHDSEGAVTLHLYTPPAVNCTVLYCIDICCESRYDFPRYFRRFGMK
jgi:cysteine dioxygenase